MAYKAPNSPPPYQGDVNSPPQAYMQPGGNSGYYNASPYQGNGYPPPQGGQGGGYYGQQNFQQGPQTGGYPQQQYGGQPQQGGYQQQQGMYAPQGQYVDPNRGRQGGGKEGFLGACLGALACCCCLDLLF